MLLAACARVGDAGGAASAGADAPDAVTLAGALTSAWRTGDRAGFVAALGPEAVRAAAMWDTWADLAAVTLQPEAEAGADGGVRLVVRWDAAGWGRWVSDAVTIYGGTGSGGTGSGGTGSGGTGSGATGSGRTGPRLAPGAQPGGGGRRPVWFDRRLAVATDAGATLLAASITDAATRQAWLTATSDAVVRLHRAPLEPWLAHWDGTIVVVASADPLDFARTTGLGAGAETTAAVTLQPTPDAAPLVVVSPAALSLPISELTSLLVHEGVHAITASSASWSGPQWLAEGLAESVACLDDPVRAARNVALARRGGGVPRIDPATAPDEAAYARAQVAYEASVERWGRATLHGWLTDWRAAPHASDAEFDEAYGLYRAASRG